MTFLLAFTINMIFQGLKIAQSGPSAFINLLVLFSLKRKMLINK